MIISRQIAFFIDYASSNFLAPLISGASNEAESRGYSICNYEAGPIYKKKIKDLSGDLLYRLADVSNCCGIFIPLTSMNKIYQKKKVINLLKKYNIPVITLGKKIEGHYYLSIENEQGIKDLVDHLINIHNYKKIGFVTGPKGNDDSNERLKAFNSSMAKNGLTINKEVIFHGDFSAEAALKLYPSIYSKYSSGKLDALVCSNDETALILIEEFKKNSITIPDDLAITGFDDFVFARNSRPSLTTINQPTYEIGKTIVRYLDSIINKKDFNIEKIKTYPIFRESCGCKKWIERANFRGENVFEQLKNSSLFDKDEIDRFFIPLFNIIEKAETKKDNHKFYRENFEKLLRDSFSSSNLLEKTISKLPFFFSILCEYCDNLILMKKLSLYCINSIKRADGIMMQLLGHKNVQANYLQNAIIQYSRNLSSVRNENDLFRLSKELLVRTGIKDCVLSMTNKSDMFNKKIECRFALKDSEIIIPDKMDSFEYDSKELLPKKLWKKRDIETDKIIYPIVLDSECKGFIIFCNSEAKLEYCEQIYSILNYAYSFLHYTNKIKEQHKNLIKARNYISDIIDSMPSLLVGIDKNLTITQWNSKAVENTGISFTDAIGKKIFELLPQLEEERENINRSIKRKVEIKKSKKLRTYKGTKVFEDITIYPLSSINSDGAVINVEDVTELVKIEEVMVQSEKMLSVGGLAAGMAHEINNPLAGMMQSAEVISNRLFSSNLSKNLEAAEEIELSFDQLTKYLKKRNIDGMLKLISESGSRAANIVSNVLSFSRKSTEGKSMHNIIDIVEKSIELGCIDFDLKHDYDFRQIQIIKEYQEKIPRIPCEPEKLQQVFMNILKNGAEAMHGSKKNPCFRIKIEFNTIENSVIVTVEDNGSGMKESVRKRIFEPFYTTKDPNMGTGLGLSVSYFIITENHNGKLEVESEINEGSKFIISLPA